MGGAGIVEGGRRSVNVASGIMAIRRRLMNNRIAHLPQSRAGSDLIPQFRAAPAERASVAHLSVEDREIS